MGKFYSDRYINNKPMNKSDYLNFSSNVGKFNGKLVETIICVCVGSIVLYTLCSMSFAVAKPLMNKIDSIRAEQSTQYNAYDNILYGGYINDRIDWRNI